MKEVTCLDCEKVFTNNDKNSMLMEMLPHYKEVHPEIIGSVDEEGKKKWMADFEKRWNEA